MDRRVFALLLRYDGGPFKGWQPHPRLPTVGGLLNAALHRVGVGATPFGASRTDAGVHARAQVASFTSRADLDPAALRQALDAHLPQALRVLALRVASRSFHAHWASTGKVYRYRISFRGETVAWRLPAPRYPYHQLDQGRLEGALEQIRRAPDVSALSVGWDRPARRIARAEVVDASDRGVTLELEATGFGRYLVRHLVGGALGVAVGALSADDLDRMLTGQTGRPPRAEADGLCLHRVLYPAPLDPFPDADLLAAVP